MRRVIFNKFKSYIPGWNLLHAILEELRNTRKLFSEIYKNQLMYSEIDSESSLSLLRYEHRTFSQHGEDGIIREIFKRIGTTNKTFVEFGVETGIECNSLLLLHDGWSGCWIDGTHAHIECIKSCFKEFIFDNRLNVLESFITAENIQSLFLKLRVQTDLDLLSIDIDGNDYWVWKAIVDYRPRVVVIEYNAIFPSDFNWIMAYNPSHVWDNSSYHGASLKALELLGIEKGYNLVYCDISGANAFFVRSDLIKDVFLSPYKSEKHYRTPNFSLNLMSAHPRNYGSYLQHPLN